MNRQSEAWDTRPAFLRLGAEVLLAMVEMGQMVRTPQTTGTEEMAEAVEAAPVLLDLCR